MKFTEAKLEQAIIELLGEQGYPHLSGAELVRGSTEVLIKDDIRAFLAQRYHHANITTGEIDSIIKQLTDLSATDLYESNKTFAKWLSDGFLLKREVLKREAGKTAGSASQKDLHIQLLDYDNVEQAVKQHLFAPETIEASPTQQPELAMVAENTPDYAANATTFNDSISNTAIHNDTNIYRFVNQLEIESCLPQHQGQIRIPDGILYINGLPLVVFEFKSASREEATTYSAFEQLTKRYRRDIPQLFVFNSLCVISDGVNNKMGNVFSPYQFFYSWGKITGQELVAQDGINSLHTMVQGLFDKARLRDVMRHLFWRNRLWQKFYHAVFNALVNEKRRFSQPDYCVNYRPYRLRRSIIKTIWQR